MNKEQLVSKAKKTLMEIEESITTNCKTKEELKDQVLELIENTKDEYHNSWEDDEEIHEESILDARINAWIEDNYDELYEDTFEVYMSYQEPRLDVIQTNLSSYKFYYEEYVFETLTGEKYEDYTDTHVTDYNETEVVDAVMKVYRDFMNVNGVALNENYVLDDELTPFVFDIAEYQLRYDNNPSANYLFTNDGESIDKDGNIITNE